MRVALILSLIIVSIGQLYAEPGQRVFFTGNSFLMRSVEMFPQIVDAAGIKDLRIAGTMLIGGTRASTLWAMPDAENPAKAALRAGEVDVFTTCSWRQLPDPGIDAFVELGLKQNPKFRVTVEEIWMAYDHPNASNPEKRAVTPWEDATAKTLTEIHADYFRDLDAQVSALNRKYGRQVALIVPTGHACIALREQIRLGKVPGIAKQGELFTDMTGHPAHALGLLNAYCHFAVIYGRSPVGLAAPEAIRPVDDQYCKPLARLLQEIAWDAVTKHSRKP